MAQRNNVCAAVSIKMTTEIAGRQAEIYRSHFCSLKLL